MCAPMRYTTRHRSVKRIFSFSSGTLNRFGSRGAVIGGSTRDGAARLLDLRAGRGRHRPALHATARRLADPRARPAALADARAMRAGWPPEARQCDVRKLGPRRLRPRLPLWPYPRLRLRLRHRLFPCLCLRGCHLDQVAHLIQHAPERRAILLHHGVLMVLQAQRFERPPLERGPADPGTDLQNAQLALGWRRQRPVAAWLALAVFPR